MNAPNASSERRRRHGLFRDEQGALSSARISFWLSLLVAFLTIGVDVALTIQSAAARIPNTVYGLEGTIFMACAAWAAGPRIAQYFGKPSEAGAALAGAIRDIRLPSRKDDERHDA